MRQAFFACSLATMIGTMVALPSYAEEPAVETPTNAINAKPQVSARDPLDSYRQRIEQILPEGWSIQAGQDKLIVTRREKVLFGRDCPNAHSRPNPPALRIDDRVYLPGQGDPKKTVFIDEGECSPDSDTPLGTIQPMPYHVFEPVSGQPAPETCNDVFYRHEQYVITLRFLPLVGEEEYRRLFEADKATKARIETVRTDLISRRLTTKYDDFLPNTSDDEKLIADYKQLKKSIRPLPRFHTKGHTVEIEDSLHRQASQFFANGPVSKQVELVRSQIEGIFSQYPLPD